MEKIIAPEDVSDPKKRFSFGKNWSNFLESLDDQHIQEAIKSLQEKLGCKDLKDKIFLDIGSGSGLFSLAAHHLGARVFSFDYDQDSVNCTKYLREKYANNPSAWSVEQGSVLNKTFLDKFEKADVLYSWGVLHHTGHMYQSFENISHLVKDNGFLFISIYNDQGGASRRWKWIKQTYITSKNPLTRFFLLLYTLFKQWKITFIKDFLSSGNPLKTWFLYGKNNRGMSPWHDLIDWTGGYPFEVAKPEDVFNFFQEKGFQLKKIKTCAGGVGCNEFVFKKSISSQ